jgi:hypothetical protein
VTASPADRAAAQAPSAAGYPNSIEPRPPDIGTGWPAESR